MESCFHLEERRRSPAAANWPGELNISSVVLAVKNLVMLALSCFADTCSAPVMMKRNPRAKC